MQPTLSLLDWLAAWRERFFANCYLNAVISAAIAVVPLQIIRGLLIASSVVFPNHRLQVIQRGLVIVIPALMNAFVSLHWAAKSRLSFAHALTLGIGSLLVISCLSSPSGDPLSHFTIPVAVLAGLMSSRLYELISVELNSRTHWLESRYRFLISIAIYLGIVLVAGSFAGLLGRSLYAWLDSLQIAGVDLRESPTFGHGLIHLPSYTLPWSFGLHGNIMFPGAEQMLNAMTDENLAAWAAGKAPLNILSKPFYDVWCNLGGTGSTLSLVIAIMLRGDRRSRDLLPVSLPLALLNINEPLIFGMPIVLNPLLIIPFVLTPAVSYCMAYLATRAGWVPHLSSSVNWSTSVILSAWHASGHSVAAVLLQLLIVAVGVLIYYPFLTVGQSRSAPGFNNKAASPLENLRPAYREMVPSNKRLEEEQAWRDASSNIDRLSTSGSFVLYFQPQVCLHTRRITGVETLIRFCTKSGNILPPTFLAHYERLGLMSDIDFWVMESTVDYIHEFLRDVDDLTISVNVSPQTLTDERLFPVVERLLNRPLPKGCTLEFEITESQKVTDPAKATQALHELSKRGIRLALDDFGSGYSTLNYLTSYPLDKIKLDRSMVLGLARPEGFSFLCQVVRLCEISRCALLIEGVETEDELKQAQAAGIRFCQGFYFHKPMAGAQLLHLLRQQQSLPA